MELLGKLLENLPDLAGPIQIGIDILILALLFAILSGGRKKRAPDADELVKHLEQIIEQTGDISKEFNSNLEDRKLLIQQITAMLDQKLAEARQMAAKLEEERMLGGQGFGLQYDVGQDEKPYAGLTAPGQGFGERQMIVEEERHLRAHQGNHVGAPLGEQREIRRMIDDDPAGAGMGD